MRYADIKFNDTVDGSGICVSFWTQGCPHRCKGCHNPETWDFNGGKELDRNIIVEQIIDGIGKYGIKRNFSILGGEPLCYENRCDVAYIIQKVREVYPNIKIYLWTGYTLADLLSELHMHPCIDFILENINILITDPFILKQRDITLKLRGSRNQHIYDLTKYKNFGIIKERENDNDKTI